MRPRYALAALFALSPLRAQAPAPGVHAGRWTYAAVVQSGDQRQDLGARTVIVVPTTTDSEDTWTVVMTMHVQGQSLTDSVIMRRSKLTPVSRHAIAGGTDLMMATDDSMAHGLLISGTSLVPLNVPLGEHSFLNYYSLRAALAGLPLGPGWKGTASVLELGADPVFSRVSLAVVDTERVVTAAGTFACWHVAVTGPGIAENYWVATDTHDVIRTREPMGNRAAILQLDLTSGGPPVKIGRAPHPNEVSCMSLDRTPVGLTAGLLLGSILWPQAPSLLGRWVGESHCVGAHPACHDEHVLYQVDTAGAHQFTLDGRRVSGRDTVDMGALSCDGTGNEPAITCHIPSGVWHFAVVQDHLEGTLILNDSSVARRVVAHRAQPR